MARVSRFVKDGMVVDKAHLTIQISGFNPHPI